MERDGKIRRSQSRAEMSAVLGNDFEDILPDLFGELGQVMPRKTFDVFGAIDFLKKGS
jgi:hypothetical protein